MIAPRLLLRAITASKANAIIQILMILALIVVREVKMMRLPIVVRLKITLTVTQTAR